MKNEIRKVLFAALHTYFDIGFYPLYRKLKESNRNNSDILIENQIRQLKVLLSYIYKYVPYYTMLFKENNITPKDIETMEDLKRVPLLNKDAIRENIHYFTPTNRQIKYLDYFCNATGGTTGTPLKYRLSRKARLLGGVLLYRGWGLAGYQLGDRMVFLGGSSLAVNAKSNLLKRVHELLRNIKKLSAFDMSHKDMVKHAKTINAFKPKFIRGYPSAIYFFARWLQDSSVRIHSPKAIFTTSEQLYPTMRDTIESVFKCKVYDGYGLNDGGLSAYECAEHCGMHIDTERSILEVIDENGAPVQEGTGAIIATDLYNYAFPFIRYQTGDIGTITHAPCRCGLQTPRLTSIEGRSVDVLRTPEGKSVHGWFFLYLFWKYQKGIQQYQVIQESAEKIRVKIIPTKDFEDDILKDIGEVIHQKSRGWKVEFEFVKEIEKSKSGKYKFIISMAK